MAVSICVSFLTGVSRSFQSTLDDRPRPTPSQPLSKFNGRCGIDANERSELCLRWREYAASHSDPELRVRPPKFEKNSESTGQVDDMHVTTIPACQLCEYNLECSPSRFEP